MKKGILKYCLSCMLTLSLIAGFVAFAPAKAYAITSKPGRIGAVSYYFIRNTSNNSYLTASNGIVSGSSSPSCVGTFFGRTNNTQKWQAVKQSDNTYWLVPKINSSLCINLWSTSWDMKFLITSSGLTSSKWKLVLQSDGTYKIYNCATNFGFAADTKVLALKSDNTLTLKDPLETGTSWFFEEVLDSTRDDTATVISYDHTIKGTGYSAYGHAATDLVTTTVNGGVFTQPIYSPFPGSATYWVNTAINPNNNKEVTARIGNFVTIKNSSTNQGCLYAHMSSFYPYTTSASTLPNFPSGQPNATNYNLYNPIAVKSKTVVRGEMVGCVGMSGSATGYHLHVEYFTNYDAIWITPTNKHLTWIYAGSNGTSIGPTYKSYVANSHGYLKHWG